MKENIKINFIKSETARTLFWILILALIVLTLPNFYRTTFIDKENYYTLRISENLINGTFFNDELSYGGRTTLIQPLLPLTLVGLSLLFGISLINLINFFGILLGLITVILFFEILKELKIKDRVFILIILILSPSFIYLFSNINKYTIPFLLSLFALLLFLKYRLKLVSIVLWIIPFYNLPIGIFVFLIFFFYIYFKSKGKMKWLLITFLISAASLLIYYSFLIRTLPEFMHFVIKDIDVNFAFQTFISDCGGKMGLSFFVVLSSIIGLISLGKKSFDYFLVICFIILLFLCSIAFNFILIYLNIILIIFAVYGLVALLNSKWESKLIKNLILIMLIVGILISGISHIELLSKIGPTDSEVKSLEFLSKEDNGVIFSHYSNGNMIAYFTKMKNVMDINFVFAPNLNERYTDSESLLNSRAKEDADKIIKKYNITYIYINERMKESLWNNENDGLLFLLNTNTFDFDRIYDESGIRIWKIRK